MSASRHSAQRGQSTVEFLVLGLAFVPLLIVTPLVAKYIDLMQAAEQASRYTAFQAVANNNNSAWPTEAALSQDVRRRFFSASEAPIKTNDAAGDFAADRNPVWTDHRGDPMIAEFANDVRANGAVQQSAGLPLVQWIADRFDLSRENLYTATVTVQPRNVVGFAPFDALDLQVTRRTAVVVDAWTARSVEQVSDRVRSLDRGLPAVPLYPQTAAFTPEMLQVFRELPPLLTDRRPSFGPATWEALPCDRIRDGC